jgi:hypothetical protein
MRAWNRVRLHNNVLRHRIPIGSVPQGVTEALGGDAHRARSSHGADLRATALAIAQLHIGKQKEIERLHLQHTHTRILTDGYATTRDVHRWTTVTLCPQCDATVITTRLMQHGEHQNQQACHVCAPPDHNADTVVPGLGQVRWDGLTKAMYTDVNGGSDLMYWNKRDHMWHRADRAS